jgi:hypothetical protein
MDKSEHDIRSESQIGNKHAKKMRIELGWFDYNVELGGYKQVRARVVEERDS